METDREVVLTPWAGHSAPTVSELEQLLDAEGLSGYQWSNGPGERYVAHSHSYDKVIYVVRGSITFGLPETGKKLLLQAADRLDLPAGTRHHAVVGPSGVVCLEAHR